MIQPSGLTAFPINRGIVSTIPSIYPIATRANTALDYRNPPSLDLGAGTQIDFGSLIKTLFSTLILTSLITQGNNLLSNLLSNNAARMPGTGLPGNPQGAGNPSGEVSPGINPNQNTGSAARMTVNERRNLNYTDLRGNPNAPDSAANKRAGKQAFNGLTGTEAAILHLGGRGHISAGESPNGVSGSTRIYNNVLNNPNNFTPDEVALISKYAAAEKAKYGYFTGESLDHDFIDQMAKRGDIDPAQAQKYHQAVDTRVQRMVQNPNQAAIRAEAAQEVNMVDDIGTLTKQSGLSKYEQAVYRLAGHATLFSGDGSINGDVLAITLNNKNSLDGRTVKGQNTNIDKETLTLLRSDLASDGKLDGDSLRYANQKVMDKIFLGGPGIRAVDVANNAIETARTNGRSGKEVTQSLRMSAQDALKQFGNFVSDHPVLTAVGAGAMAASAGVCPFLAGTMAVGAGIAAGNNMLSNNNY